MKKKLRFPLFIIACATAFLYSCSGGSPAKMFVKKWQMESFKSKAFDDQVAMLKQAADTTKDSMTKAYLQHQLSMVPAMMDNMKKMVLTCNVDGTCEISQPDMSGQTTTTKEKWTLIADGKKVVMNDEEHHKMDTLNIDELTANEMTVSMPDDKGGKVIMTYKAIQ